MQFGGSAGSFRRALRTKKYRLCAVGMAAALVVPFVTLNHADAAEGVATAEVIAPDCGTQARIELTAAPGGAETAFHVNRNGVLFTDAYVWTGTAAFEITVGSSAETLTVTLDDGTLLSTGVVQATDACSPARPTTPAVVVNIISASVSAPACGSEAPVVINNGNAGARWFEVWNGASNPEVLFNISGNQSLTEWTPVTTKALTTRVIWSQQTLATKSVTSAATKCAWDAPTLPPSNPTTTTTAVLKNPTPAKTCATADKRTAFGGCPIFTDAFNGTSLSTNATTGWSLYNDATTKSHARVKSNVKVSGGIANMTGTYNKSTGLLLGSGAANNIQQKYGRYEVRMKVDKGKGWSAVSLLWPTLDKNFPKDGEIDMFEVPWSTRQTIANYAHNGANNDATGKKYQADATTWHTYAVEWTPTKLTYYRDGKVTWTTNVKKYIPTTGTLHFAMQLDPSDPKTCAASSWWQCPDSTTPASMAMHMDYLKVWKYGK